MSDYFPEEVVANILLRLSVNDLVRCRRVSKQWLSIIDDPHFIRLQLQRSISSNSNAALFLQDRKSPILYCKQNYSSDICFFSIPIHYEPSQVLLMGSCHGLVCFSLFNHPNDFVVLNPSTGERHTVSCPMVERRAGESLKGYGFGYDESSDDYKVVRIIETKDDSDNFSHRAEIYGVRSKGFLQIVPLPAANWRHYDRKSIGVFVGGAIHWGTMLPTDSFPYKHVIDAIDLASNTYHELQCPCYKFGETGLASYCHDVGILDTSLCLCGVLETVRKVGIWVMEEYGNPESWSMRYCIDNNEWRIEWCLPHSDLIPVGSNLDKILLVSDWERFIWINIADGTVVADDVKWLYGSYEPIYCLESLVKIFPDKGADVKKDAYEKQLKRIAVSDQEIPKNSHPDFLYMRNLNALMFKDYVESESSDESSDDFGDEISR